MAGVNGVNGSPPVVTNNDEPAPEGTHAVDGVNVPDGFEERNADALAMLDLQKQTQTDSFVLNTLTNISKAEHEEKMAVVRNLKG